MKAVPILRATIRSTTEPERSPCAVVGQRRAKLEDQAKTVKPVGVRPRAAQEPRPVSGLADLQHRAGNRAVVNLLHNDGADSAQRVQRRLIPKVNDAFDEAIAHEPRMRPKSKTRTTRRRRRNRRAWPESTAAATAVPRTAPRKRRWATWFAPSF